MRHLISIQRRFLENFIYRTKMIITDKKIVQDTLDKILDKASFIAIDKKDIQDLFGKDPQIRMIQVAANSINELIPIVNQDFESIGDPPDKILVAYVCMDLKMSDLALLEDITRSASHFRRAIIFEKSTHGRFFVYCFFK